jgi:hypothetical protein
MTTAFVLAVTVGIVALCIWAEVQIRRGQR